MSDKKNKRILIVEDERPMARVLKLKLRNVGYRADMAFDGGEALEAIKKRKYSLILLDLMMPRVDGFGVLSHLQEHNIKVKVIVSTNLSQVSDIKRAKKLGAVDYFVKSDTPISEVIKTVEKNLKKK